MLSLKGERIYLRAIEPNDLDFLYQLENDTSIWEISGTTAPYAKHILELYLQNAYKDIYEAKQLRLCICDFDDTVLGLVDLFDFDPANKKVGLGIIVSEKKKRNKGVGAEALELACNYVFKTLQLHQIYANVLVDNEPSKHLFKKMGFNAVGVKKDWIFTNGKFKDEILYQKINN
ncbi:N-acetyltransferase GCN5 [Cellulophaga geojensis KL-A]|uniref:N-acetyltransferase GCN5 n=1 Tax=Cellulophaga geojensis KL-A TaxID=1328323 RepID=A0ABN0RNL4_9FLAO|nr:MULTISPECIES: GNAT family protein [Cellulophaga]EWH13495.1 N-acetyltransferase GCN5 [Cellulophaga geojensis KL-A]MDO6852992.1 GNAT family protein [Cellulophaga lytica]